MRTPSLRTIFSSILLAQLGAAAAALNGCIVVVEPDEPYDVPDPAGAAGSPGKAGTSGSWGDAGSPGTAGKAGTGGKAGTAGSAGVAGAGGAGGAGGGYTIPTEGFDPMSCSPLLAGAAAKLGVDSIELWSAPFIDGQVSQQEADGAACAGAPDRPACFAALEEVRAQTNWTEFLRVLVAGAPGYVPERLVVTKNGAVTVIDSDAELKALLGPIDALEKLRFVSHYSSLVGCELVRRTELGYEVIGQELVTDCPMTYQRRLVEVTTAGDVSILAEEAPVETGGCAGRRPAGLSEQAVGSNGALARYLERQAYLEGASVEAFERFALELAALGAPADLVARARRAREDEVRHHALLVALGRRFDPSFTCQAPAAAPARPRSLYEFALENAVEGCVRETWGALLACHQAARADDGAVRFASTCIAEDETRHAELSWATHAWLLGRLSAGERATIEAAMQAAAAELGRELEAGSAMTEGERGRLGLPAPGEACALLASLREQLWARPLAA